MLKNDLLGLFFVTFLAMTAAMLTNYLSPTGIAWVGNWDKSRGVVSAQAKNQEVDHRIEINTFAEMKAVVDSQAALIIDVRAPDDYAAGHIPSAVSMPITALDRHAAWLFENVAPDRLIVCYCSSRECEYAHEFARHLKEMGYTRLKVYSGGFLEWNSHTQTAATDN